MFLSFQEPKNSTDIFIWKSNTLQNQINLQVDLISSLEQGRYLIETKNGSSKRYIYAWILSDNSFFKHIKSNFASDVNLSLRDFYLDRNNRSKKIMYKHNEGKEAADDKWFNELNNDFNISNLLVSNEQFELMLGMLQNSTSQLCESLKLTNEYFFAIV